MGERFPFSSYGVVVRIIPAGALLVATSLSCAPIERVIERVPPAQALRAGLDIEPVLGPASKYSVRLTSDEDVGNDDWTTPTTLLTSVLVVLTGIYVWVCRRQMAASERAAESAAEAAKATSGAAATSEKALRTQVWLAAMELLHQSGPLRAKVFEEERAVDATEWTDSTRATAASVEEVSDLCRAMETFASLIENAPLPEWCKPINVDDTFCKAWIVMGLYVLQRESEFGGALSDEERTEAGIPQWAFFKKRGRAALRGLRWPSKWWENAAKRPTDQQVRDLWGNQSATLAAVGPIAVARPA